MKGHPANPRLIEIDLDSRFMDFFNLELRSAVERDERERWVWIQKIAKYHARRYGLDRRKPNFPFVGSADVWPPIVDLIIEQMKPIYLSPLLLGNPPVNVIPQGEPEEDRSNDVETWFEYELNHDSPHFFREQNYYVDDILSCGWGTLKTSWAYETRTAPETIDIDSIPPELAQRIIIRRGDQDMQSLGLSEKLFDKLAWESQVFGNQIFPPTASLLEAMFDLDREDPTDRLAMDQILEWMRQGAQQPLTFKKRDTITDAPATTAVMGENLIIPAYATDIEDCFQVTHEMWMNGYQVRSKQRDQRWRPEAADQIMKAGRGMDDPRFGRNGIQQIEAARQGMTYTSGEKFPIRETCTYFDFDRDGVDEKIIVLWSKAAETPLRAYVYDRPSGKWPYHITEYERNKRGIYAPRGIPERLQDIEREVVVQKRAELNRLIISTALSLLVKSTSPLANQAVRWVPGEKLIVNDVDRDVKPLMMQDLSVVFQRQEQIWKTWSEQREGTPNYSLAESTSAMTEPRTKYEIQAIQGQGAQIGNVRTACHRETMSEVFTEMFTLYQRLGPKEKWIAVTGSDPLKISQEDLQGNYKFSVNQLFGVHNPELEAQKALARLQILMQVQASGAMPPDTMIDLGAAVEMYLRKDDPRAAKRIIRKRTPEEMQQLQQEQDQMSQVQGMLGGIEAAKGLKVGA